MSLQQPAERDDERRNLVNLLRFVGLVGAFPFLTIGAAMAAWDYDVHKGHAWLFFLFGSGLLALALAAPVILRR